MALYAFDGTWNENEPNDAKDTNVIKFYEAYSGPKWYVEGPGTRFGVLGKLLGGVFGSGGRTRIKEACAALERNFEAGEETIDIVGFSRGAALALALANRIARHGALGRDNVAIRFVGVWDVVPSFGIPGNDINLGYVLSLPPNVAKCYHAMALDERRGTFKVQRLVTTVQDAMASGRVYEVWFRGGHSDVGGGNGNVGLSSIALHWMYKQALASGLPLASEAVARARSEMNPAASVSKNIDPVKDPHRPIPWTDSVHVSVRFVPGAHNPPAGLRVVDDDGNARPQGFIGS